MENEIKPMTKKELIKKIEEYKPKYIYQRYNGDIRQFEVVNNNYLVDTKSGMSFDFRSHLMLGKVSKNLIDLIERGDYVNGKEVKHIADFEGIEQPIRKVIFVDKTHLIPGETAENKDIKTIVTKEMMESISYKVKE